MAFFVVNRGFAEVCAKVAEERKGEIVGVLRVTQRCWDVESACGTWRFHRDKGGFSQRFTEKGELRKDTQRSKGTRRAPAALDVFHREHRREEKRREEKRREEKRREEKRREEKRREEKRREEKCLFFIKIISINAV
ncbi:hypothetical protein [Brumimicrobium glaciale]|uniref:hypothetical protein n=1 Tax=Brumimicrobium glaciale TaxID=200475 RepID=UPI0013EB113E|nr:hypothetical protein [Brumimicrobium glaciale]